MSDIISLGVWIKRRRKALDLTQTALAQRVGCSLILIQKIEADARRPSREIAARLADVLELADDERAPFIQAARMELSVARLAPPTQSVVRGAFVPTQARSAEPPEHHQPLPSTNLPIPLTTLIGRVQEIAQVCALLHTPQIRLVTLTGPGGTGKTRLGLQVATELIDSFPDGVYFVDLAPIREPTLVISAIVQTLGIQEAGSRPLVVQLKQFLTDKHMLLLLDNFEHLLEAAPVVTDLLATAPHLTVLLTSRVVVGVYGEQIFPVPPLLLPDLNALPPLDQLLQVETLRLFVERARAARPDFSLTHANARTVSEICHRLDGLPLAIELAAMRMRLLAPQALLDRLSSRLSMLSGGSRTLPARQQTLRDTLAWSYDLLNTREQILFRWLAVFVGGCTLAAVEFLCALDGDRALDALKDLASLLDNSLVQQREGTDGEPRFSMLETIREYALEHLVASGEFELMEQRHATFFVTLAELAERAARDQNATQQVLWLDRLEIEHPNLRAALVWCCTQGDASMGLRLVIELDWFWAHRSYMHEARSSIVEALTPRGGASQLHTATSQLLRAKALGLLGTRAIWWNDLDTAQPLLAESLALYRELGETWNCADILGDLGMVSLYRGDYAQCAALLDESLSLFQQLDDKPMIAWSFFYWGTLLYTQGDPNGAADLWKQGLALTRPFESTWSIAVYLVHLGLVALDLGDYEQSRVDLRESLTRFRDLGERWNMALVLEVCAGLAAAQAHQRADVQLAGRRAARLFGAAEALRETLGAPPLLTYRDHYQRGVTATRSLLDEEAFAAAWAAGRALPLEQVIAEALNC